jgi:hypothetical protein
LVKESPHFSIRESRVLFERPGSLLHIQPLLPGVRVLSGEKMQAYLASELRDRIARSGVQIQIIDKSARKQLIVEPRAYRGRLIHELPEMRSPFGEITAELYLTEPSSSAGVGLYKSGTRIIDDITKIDALSRAPWNTGYLEGIIDADFLQLTPGTRVGIIFDESYDSLQHALQTIEPPLIEHIDAQRRAEEEEASRSILKKISRALREAFFMLPEEAYGWLAAKPRRGGSSSKPDEINGHVSPSGNETAAKSDLEGSIEANSVSVKSGQPGAQQEFFEIAGPLHRVDIRPSKATVGIGKEKKLTAVARDRSRRNIESDVDFAWSVEKGEGSLDHFQGEFVTYLAPAEPELATIRVVAEQGEIRAEAESLITITAELISAENDASRSAVRGLPGYTYAYEPGSLWRSHYSADDALITVNSGHPDFVHASKQQSSKLRYIARLFAKEIILENFPGANREELLERMVELNLYMDEHLR